MTTSKITVNKTPERPEGIEIEVVVPENALEERVLNFLMHPLVTELKRDNRIPYDLPRRYKVEHGGKGTFVLSGYSDGIYYEPPKPLAVMGLRVAGASFDLIHAEPRVVREETTAAPAQAPAPPAPPSQPATAEDAPPRQPAGENQTPPGQST